ncbi:capsule assembly Wzi family protein [Salinimicrobium sp. HB62]|uniref:capsule assembly Wzi family protein n=1 Tax=Salinimicrobium sp. HB62 TaxID=3077781 RepID=UPI002D77D568|nr:capsule assembly Wzi family protein [Salinimicrobium sp. HB62]
MFRKLPLLLFLIFSATQAQEVEYNVSATGEGILYSGEESPFWIHSNRRGRIDEITNVSSWITGTGRYEFRYGGILQAGLGVLYHDGYSSEAQLDEYFVSFENSRIDVFAGRKQNPESFSGVSATNENVLWSNNSRPIPGIGIDLKPLTIFERAGIGFKASWDEFFSDEQDRYIQNIRIHHKSFHFIFNGIRNIELVAGGHHYVQWGGKSEEYGELPASFEDYLRVITGGSIIGGDGFVGEQEVNGLGNHLGGYEVQLNTSISHFDVSLIYNTIFEDYSGIKLRNTPDGRYGIYIKDQQPEKWVQAFMYEYYYTRHQSKTYPTTDGKDNYFNNHLYRSGWTYENRIIGLPFMMLDEDRFRVAHNNIVAHHIGLTGLAYYTYPYKFLASYRANYGAKGGTSKPVEQIISTYLDVNVWQDFINVNLQFGADIYFEENSSNVGLGLRIQKSFF